MNNALSLNHKKLVNYKNYQWDWPKNYKDWLLITKEFWTENMEIMDFKTIKDNKLEKNSLNIKRKPIRKKGPY